VLLKPINSQFWLSFHSFSLWGVPDLLFGLGIIVYAGNLLGVGAGAYLLAIIPLVFGMVIMYSLWFMLGATSIWFTKIYNMTEVLKGLLAAGRFPIGAYPATYRFFFTFVVPVTFLTTVPAEMLLGRGDPLWTVSSGCLAVVLLILSDRVWRFALRFYTSASS
jgi:ABC-2 type transport system permease protein